MKDLKAKLKPVCSQSLETKNTTKSISIMKRWVGQWGGTFVIPALGKLDTGRSSSEACLQFVVSLRPASAT